MMTEAAGASSPLIAIEGRARVRVLVMYYLCVCLCFFFFLSLLFKKKKKKGINRKEGTEIPSSPPPPHSPLPGGRIFSLIDFFFVCREESC